MAIRQLSKELGSGWLWPFVGHYSTDAAYIQSRVQHVHGRQSQLSKHRDLSPRCIDLTVTSMVTQSRLVFLPRCEHSMPSCTWYSKLCRVSSNKALSGRPSNVISESSISIVLESFHSAAARTVISDLEVEEGGNAAR